MPILEATPDEVLDERAAPAPRILVVDDQADVREALRLLLKAEGFAIDTAASPQDALKAAENARYGLIAVDMNFTWDTTSGDEGLRLVESLHELQPAASIIAMTGWSTVELAVEAMQLGACDFIPKPWDNRRLLSSVRKHWNSHKRAEIAPRRRELEAELEIARKVQKKLLPPAHFSATGLECECATLAAREIGGDFYDFFKIEPGMFAFLLADVSGKGVGAALLAANLQASIRGQRDLARSPEKLLARVNQLFFESTRPEHFATLFYGVYEAASRTIRYVSCGHPPAVLVREDGTFELLESSATMLGAFRRLALEERSITLHRGDRLVLFSDGFSEAQLETAADDDERWVLETILPLARSHRTGLADALASRAARGGNQADDITVLDLRAE
ncbi:MAG TPA: SpoIIE family protein phosphatase [Bryobacteraceae bacterium]|nr:SpoIIE family protein phosphatase [Bryobacteraceae bacterium]